MGDEAQETAADMDRLQDTAAATSSTTSDLAGASSNADELLFSLGDTAQDAQHGIRGIGNNIGFAAEQMATLSSQAGGVPATMSALRASLLGPAGAVFAIQALIALGPKIVDFFQSWIGGAEEATEKTKELKEETRSALQNFLDRLRENPEAAAAGLDVLEQSAEQLQQRLGDLFAEGADPDQIEKVSGRLEAVRNLISSLRRDAEDEDTFIALTDVGVPPGIAEQLIDVASSASDAQEETSDFADEVERLEELSAAGLDLATNIDQELKEAREEFERGQEILRSIQIREQRDDPGPLEGQIGPDRIQAPQLSAEDFQTETVQQINSAIGVLERRMDQFDSSNFRKQMQVAKANLEEMRKEMKLAKGEAIDLGPELRRGLTQAITNVADAVGSGENVASALLETLATLAQRVGSLLIAFGIGGDSLKTLVTNPGTAIAAGAALVALGSAAKSAISSEVDSATSGQGSARSSRLSRQDIEGGGEARADIPGFEQGVDNFEGGLAEVHRNEVLALPPASSVITNENVQALQGALSVLSTSSDTGGGSSTQDVNVNAGVDVRVGMEDGFRVVEQIERIQKDREDLVGGR